LDETATTKETPCPTGHVEELSSLERTHEIRVAGRRNDGTFRTPVIVWHVVVGGVLHVRSVRGTEGQWYKGVVRHFEGAISWAADTREVTSTLDSLHDSEIDAAYAAKYGTGSATRAASVASAKTARLTRVLLVRINVVELICVRVIRWAGGVEREVDEHDAHDIDSITVDEDPPLSSACHGSDARWGPLCRQDHVVHGSDASAKAVRPRRRSAGPSCEG
jgi:hypothetical protein